MKVCVPEISWHNCEPVYSIHIYPKVSSNEYYVATGSADRLVRIWRIQFETTQSNPVRVIFIAEFTVHQSSVNAVRFSPNGKYLLSGSDDRTLVLWEVGAFETKSSTGDEDVDARDIWPVKRILRGHLEGVYDLSWSPCNTRAASASVDNSVIVWDIKTGNKLAVLREAKSYVQGVAWDPKNEFIVTLSSDRQARFYSIAKAFHCVSRMQQAAPVTGGPNPQVPAPPLFADDMVTRSFFRRAGFSPDGRFVILSGGVVEVPTGVKSNRVEKESLTADKTEGPPEKSESPTDVELKVSSTPTPTPTPTPNNGSSSSQPITMQRHAAHLVVLGQSGKPKKPILSWPSPKRAIVSAAFCPLTFEPINSIAKKRDAEGLPVPVGSLKTRRRFVAALVAADALIIVETSRTCRPIGYIGGLHLDQLTDASWSSDGRLLMSCSTDGYCTLVVFGQNELGIPMAVQPVVTFNEESIAVPKKKKQKKPAPVTESTEEPTVPPAENVIKKRITPLPVSGGVAPSPSFSGVGETEASKSSLSSEGVGSVSGSSKMEVDGEENARKAEQTVTVLIPRRRVNLTTVSAQPGASSSEKPHEAQTES